MLCKIRCFLVLFFSVVVMAGCGAQTEGDDAASGTETGVLSSSESQVIISTNSNSELVWIGAQYYNNEAVSLWRKMNNADELAKTQDIYLQDEAGNHTLVSTGAPGKYVDNWYITRDGYGFASSGNSLARIEADGTVTYEVSAEGGILDICQIADGRIAIVMLDQSGAYKLAQLEPENGKYTKLDTIELDKDKRLFLAAGETGLLLLKKDGFWEVNLDSQELTKIIPISEYDFRLGYTVQDFKMLDGGSVEFLFEGNSEVQLPKDIDKYRTVITVRTFMVEEWLQALAEEFNRTNLSYYVEFETLENWTGEEALPEYLQQLYAELESGAGPDIITGELMFDAQTSMDNSLWFVNNGYLEDLAPYMESSGIYEDDYFPCTFEALCKDEKIYGALSSVSLLGLKIKEEALGGRAVEDIETFVDTLLNYPTPAVLMKYWGATHVLDYLLCGSEDLWGAIDWEARTCDFQTDFFARLLEVSMLYASDWRVEMPEVAELIDTSFYGYESQKQLRLANEVYIGYFFDDGVHPVVSANYDMLAINSNSNQKEGAWAFIEFLLSENTQTQKNLIGENGSRIGRAQPVNVLAFEEVALLEMEEGAIVEYVVDGEKHTFYKAGSEDFVELGRDKDAYNARYGVNEEEVEEIREMMYSARYLPKETAPVLAIIYEESEAYFAGNATLADTCDAIQKRVQEYLEETAKE